MELFFAVSAAIFSPIEIFCGSVRSWSLLNISINSILDLKQCCCASQISAQLSPKVAEHVPICQSVIELNFP